MVVNIDGETEDLTRVKLIEGIIERVGKATPNRIAKRVVKLIKGAHG